MRARPRIIGAALALVLVATLGGAAAMADRHPGLEYHYDLAGRLQAVVDRDAGTAAVYRYDEAGNLLGVERMPAGRVPPAPEPPPAPAPLVTAISRTLVTAGDELTITGGHFTGEPELDLVVLGGASYATVESAAPDELVVTVPPNARSGTVSVATPAGTGHSDQELFVVPWPDYAGAEVGSVAPAELGTSATAGLDAPGQVALLRFDGRAGQRVAVELSGPDVTCGQIRLGLAGPDGDSRYDPDDPASQWCHGGRDQPVTLPADGQYLLLVTWRDQRTGPVTVTLSDVGGAAPAGPPEPELAGERRPISAPGGVFDGADLAEVDLATGALVTTATDLTVRDTMPLVLTRGYTPVPGFVGNRQEREFGIGAGLEFGTYLQLSTALQFADLILPDGGRVEFARVTEGVAEEGAVFAPGAERTPWAGAQIRWNGAGWDLTTGDGTTLAFDDHRQAALVAIRDRHGSTITVDRDRPLIGLGVVRGVYTPAGRWLRFEYDDQDRIVAARDHLGRTVRYAYHDERPQEGLLASVTTWSGAAVSYRYDDQRRVTEIAAGAETVHIDYDGAGRVARQRLADGTEFTFTYRTGEETVEVTDPDGELVERTVERITEAEVTGRDGVRRRVGFAGGYWVSDEYGVGLADGQRFTAERDPETGFITSLAGPDGWRSDYRYDQAGYLVSVTDAPGTADETTVDYGRDPVWPAVGSVAGPDGQQQAFSYDESGNLAAAAGPDGAETSYEYDRAGRVTAVTGPDGQTLRVDYELAHRVTVTDAAGGVREEFYDAAGRLAAVTDAAGATTRYRYDQSDRLVSVRDPGGAETRLDYHDGGRLSGFTDPAGNRTGFGVDDRQRVVTRTDPTGAVDEYRYDEAGRLVGHVDRRGVVTTYRHDELGRLARVEYDGSAAGLAGSTLSYRYDEAGRLAEVDDSAYGTIRREYDQLGRLVSETTPDGTVSYRYDRAGRRVATELPDGTETRYRYDGAGRLAEVDNGHATVEISRDPAGRVSQRELPGGLTAHYRTDARGLVTGIAYRDRRGGLVGGLRYGYDPAGRIRTAAGGLAATDLPGPAGRREHDQANRLVRAGDTELVYDRAGNLVDDGVHRYTWDARGQLVEVDGPTRAEFAYDPFGRRVAKTVDGATTRYRYDGENVAQQSLPDGTTVTYLTGPERDQVYARTADGVTHAYLTDVRGSVVGMTGPDATVATRYTYGPYGATAGHGAGDPNRFGFTGRERDETGLYYHRNRYYHPGLARFISEDPLGFDAGDANLYRYGAGDPVNHTDPDGRQAVGLGGLLAAAMLCATAMTSVATPALEVIDGITGAGPEGLSDAERAELDRAARQIDETFEAAAYTCELAYAAAGWGGLAKNLLAGAFGRGGPPSALLPGLTLRVEEDLLLSLGMNPTTALPGIVVESCQPAERWWASGGPAAVVDPEPTSACLGVGGIAIELGQGALGLPSRWWD